MNEKEKPRIRWLGAAGILLLAFGGLAWISRRDISQQDRNLKTGALLIVTFLALYLWAILFARFRSRTRLIVFVGGLATIGFFASSLKIVGVSGDLIPIVRFRWSAPRQLAAPTVATLKTNAPPKSAVATASFPQFLGPNRNGIIPGVNLETNWMAHPPQELWRREVGNGWTGFAIADGLAITQEQRGENEMVTAYALESGAPVWSHSDTARYFTTLGGEGPRANPTVENGRVYAFGGMGILNCLDFASGKVIWSVDIPREHGTTTPEWGYAGAPLLFNGFVIINASATDKKRSLVSHDAVTGKFAWGAGDDSAGYSSPTLFTLCGVPQIVFFTQKHVAGFDPRDGTALWEHPWPGGHPHVSMPVQISTNQVLASSGYGNGSELIEIARSPNGTNSSWKAERVWKTNRLKSKFANMIVHGGFVYGLDDGILTCLDPATGERKWHGERHGHGQLLLIGNVLLLMAENGEILLLNPSPQGEEIIVRHKALKGKTWNPPAFASPYLLVRNDQEAVALKLPLK